MKTKMWYLDKFVSTSSNVEKLHFNHSHSGWKDSSPVCHRTRPVVHHSDKKPSVTVWVEAVSAAPHLAAAVWFHCSADAKLNKPLDS